MLLKECSFDFGFIAYVIYTDLHMRGLYKVPIISTSYMYVITVLYREMRLDGVLMLAKRSVKDMVWRGFAEISFSSWNLLQLEVCNAIQLFVSQ
jgi:hypothetical protein